MSDNGTERHSSSPDGRQARRKASTPRRPIGWRAANRMVKGKDGGRGAEDLHTLIEMASGPMSAATLSAESSPSSTAAEHASASAAAEDADHEAMLAAFRESGAAGETGGAGRSAERGRAAAGEARTSVGRPAGTSVGRRAGRAARGRRASLALVLRFAAAILIVCGVGVAAASAGVLPPGAQRIAHEYFGIGVGGASAPSTHAPSSSAVTSGAPGRGRGGGGNSAAASPSMTSSAASPSSYVLVSLCQRVFQDPGKWEQDLSAADQATLIAAAHDENKVKSYCAQLLAGVGKGATPPPTPTPGNGAAATGTLTPAPSASTAPTVTHGKAHASRSPESKGNG